MHGRLSGDEKDAVMSAFRAGEIDVLVCTTVIEVGVDVPNATVMVVMDADRFGISQLHQLRGRIGRGAAPEPVPAGHQPARGAPRRARGSRPSRPPWTASRSPTSTCEERREGDVLGLSQSGRPITLRLLSLAEHREIIEAARAFAESVYAADPKLLDAPRNRHAGSAVRRDRARRVPGQGMKQGRSGWSAAVVLAVVVAVQVTTTGRPRRGSSPGRRADRRAGRRRPRGHRR